MQLQTQSDPHTHQSPGVTCWYWSMRVDHTALVCQESLWRWVWWSNLDEKLRPVFCSDQRSTSHSHMDQLLQEINMDTGRQLLQWAYFWHQLLQWRMSFHQIQLSIEVLSRIRMIEIIKSLDFHLFKPFLFQKFFQMQQVSHQSVYVYKFHQENLVCKLSLKHLHLEDQFLQRDLPELHGQSILFITHVKKIWFL